MPYPLFLFLAALVVGTAPAGAATADTTRSEIVLDRLPAGALQPQVVIDDRGGAHLVYFEGEPAAGDLYYVFRAPGDEHFGEPIRVNAIPESAIATGTIRGAQLAVGRAGRVHVVWNGSGKRPAPGFEGMPLWYARLDERGSAFEEQRNLAVGSHGLDGGSAVAAASDGSVYVFWHTGPHGGAESERRVYLATSRDDGATFDAPRIVSADVGACGCCGMRASVGPQGAVYVLFRAARQNVHRDLTMLVSGDRGASFETVLMDPWELQACPMTSAAMAATPEKLHLSWETKQRIYHAALEPGTAAAGALRAAPASTAPQKHPSLAVRPDGMLLLAWVEGAGWGRGGDLVWQRYGAGGRPLGEPGRVSGVPAWSFPAAFVDAEGLFHLLY